MTQLVAAVIIPTFRRPELLLTAVRSAFDQSYVPDEIIVVAACPEERSSIAMTLATTFPPEVVRVVSSTHRLSGGAARNLGVASSRAQYLFFLDDDDMFLPDKIQTHLAAHHCSGASLVYSEAVLMYHSGMTERAHLSIAGLVPFDRVFHQSGVNPSSTSCVSIERASFTACGGFDEGLESYQDIDLWYRLSLEGALVFSLQKAMTVFVQHLDARVSTNFKKRRAAGDVLLAKHGNAKYLAKLVAVDRTMVYGRVALTRAHAGEWSALLLFFVSILHGRTALLRRQTAGTFQRMLWALLKRKRDFINLRLPQK